MSMPNKPVKWPAPWAPITDEARALAFGRLQRPELAATVVEELRREICPDHPLFGVECRVLAWHTGNQREFLLETDRADMPLVLVHLTWSVESQPHWPFIIPYQSVEDFLCWARSAQ